MKKSRSNWTSHLFKILSLLWLSWAPLASQAAPPAITLQPISQNVSTGAVVSLVAAVSGTPAPGFQWFKDGSALVGATASTLTFTNAQATNAGSYYLVATNSGGEAITIPALVSVGGSQLIAWGDDSAGEFGNTNNRPVYNGPVGTGIGAVVAAAGAGFSLIVDGAGNLWSAGTNNVGQLGLGGSLASTNAPQLVATNVVAIAAGSQHALFVTGNGQLWGMGSNLRGQLGLATNIVSTNLPSLIASNVVAAAAGGLHSLFLQADGSLWALGENGDGELGIGYSGSFTNRPTLAATNVTTIAAGYWHSLFLTTDSRLWGCGDNVQGQLGYVTNENLYFYISQPLPIATNVVSMAGGFLHSLFAKSDGSLWSMGANNFGQLGLVSANTNAIDFSPQRVTTASNVVAVSAGYLHSLFQQSDGSVWAAGNNAQGQVGSSSGYATIPVRVYGPGLVSAEAVSGPAANHSLCVGLLPAPTPPLASLRVSVSATNTLIQGLTTGAAPITYQWWKNGIRLAGLTTNTSLLFANTAFANSGVYTLVASNALGISISVPALCSIGTPLLMAWGDNSYGQFANATAGYATNLCQITGNDFLQSVAGNGATFFINFDSSGHSLLWAAGNNANGQLGDGFNDPTDTPIAMFTNAVSVVAGNDFSLFIDGNATLWSEGNNAEGELGLGVYNSGANVPQETMTNVVAAAAGYHHSLILQADGTLWGAGYNQDGELGIGTLAGANAPVFISSNVVAIAAGGFHSFFITADGQLWGMGRNSAGQLGLGFNSAAVPAPSLVASAVAAVASGSNHTLFLKLDGSLWGMGDNSSGQLGLGAAITSVNVPAQIAANVQELTAGAQHSVFQDGQGNLWAMGANNVGQLGDGTYANSFVPEIVAPGVLVSGLSSGPTANHTLVSGLPQPASVSQPPANQTVAAGAPLAFSVVASGFPPFTYQWWKNGAAIPGATNASLTVANTQLTDSGLYNVVVTGSFGMAVGLPVRGVVSTLALIACGLNTSAQLGIYTNNPSAELSPVGTPSAAIYAQAGADFSAFLDAAGILWTVGANSYGELGQGLGSGYQMVPRPVATNVVCFSACENTLLFVKSDQTLWAVGNNAYDQFGVASPPSANIPVYVTNGVALVAVGGFHSMMIKTNGQLFVAGNNGYGQLGLGTAPSAAGFTHLADGVCAVSGGYDHSLYITTNGSLWAMGNNTHGQIGDGTLTTRKTPVLVASNVLAATAGAEDSMFILSDHTLWTAGYNYYGQLGNGSTSDTNRPTVIASNVVAVAAGQSHTVFVQTNGAVWGMGYDFVGQLGLGPNNASQAWPVRLLNGAPVACASTGPTAQHTLFIAAPLPPVITSQPLNQTLALGNQASFSVSAFGFAPFAYQWLLNSNNLTGAASSNLTLLSVATTNAGVYQVIVANGFGSVTGGPARLAIAPVPSLASPQWQADRTMKVACESNQLTIGGRLLAATNLLTPASQWLTLTNFPAGPAAPMTFIDTGATNYRTRYYRTVWP